MKITVSKSSIEAGLAPILKMVANAKLPSDARPTVTFQSDKQRLWIACPLTDRQLKIALMDAFFDEKNMAFTLDLEAFRQKIADARGTHLVIEQDASCVILRSDEVVIGQLATMKPIDQTQFQIPSQADYSILPTNFATFILQAFSCVSTDRSRLALTGVNLFSHGIAGTDGKQLFHLPLPLQFKESLTLPPSKEYAVLKHRRWNSLAHWKHAGSERMFAISGEGFQYIAKALDVVYPQYWQVMPPEEKNGDAGFTLTKEGAATLQTFLDEKKGTIAKLTVHPERMELEIRDEKLESRKGVFAATGKGERLPCSIHINPCYLRQFLKMGFISMSFSSKGSGPLVSSGGIGRYLFMPYGGEPQSSAASDTTAAAASSPNPVAISPNPTHNPINQPKEKTMNTQSITPNVNPNATAVSRIQTSVPSNPLDETLASLTAMREQLSNLESRLMEAGRKIKAALIEQRQKERLYADATRKLERIRLAV